MSACGKQRARIEPPHPPSIPSAENGEPSKSAIPPKHSEAPSGNIPPPAIVAEALESPEKRLNSAKGTPLGPTIRIGLFTDAEEIQISANGNYTLLQNRPETSKEPVHGRIRIGVEPEGGTAETTACYRIQVASLRSRESAEKLRKDLAETLKAPVTVHENDEATSNRVRVGEFPTRSEAQGMLDTLKRSGYPDAFIVEDVRSTRKGKPILALRGPDKLFYLSRSGFLFFPASDTDFLSVNGKAYRGLLDVRINSDNRITVINQLGIEEYLPGVVPAEINPVKYPEFAALAAQAIAARTYALRHMGRYGAQGFDLTDDTRTQVYEGVAAEKGATDEAVRRTAGLAIYYEDKPIDAMYMSTCGGRTEDFSNVYDAQPVPYLQSVVCDIENNPGEDGTIITGNHILEAPVLTDDGSVANRNLEFARILGIIDAGLDFSPEYLAGTTTQDEATGWIKNTLKVIQSSRKNPAGEPAETRIGFLKYAAESVFGSDEIRRKISPRDAAYYIGNLKDGDGVPETARSALAYLMQKILWRPFSDNTVRPNDPIRRSEAIFLLLRWAESIRPDILRHGVFTGTDFPPTGENTASELQVKWGSSIKSFRLSDTLPVFRMEDERRVPVESIKMIGNEKTYFHVGPHEIIDFIEVELNPTGSSSDRYSPAATWEATLTRSDVATKLRSLAGNIGEFRDLEPSRIGNSGRAVQIRIIGSRSSVVLNGYKVRGALGLKDTLFTLTRKQNPDGSVAEFTFHGRGYGHGVGLCQVGAFGMAKAGKSYEEILKTYYRGVDIRKAY